MNINEIEKIIPKEKILQNVQMKKYTSFKIGGEAEVLIKISTLEELTKIIKYINQKNIQTFILGNGSNLLVSDEGIKGIVLKIEIKKLNLRNSFYYDLIDYHNNYDTPLDLFMFMDEDKFPIPVAHNGFRTRIEIENYVNKLKEMYDVNYYEVIPNKDFTNLSFTPKNDIEKIIRIIPIKDNHKFKSNK